MQTSLSVNLPDGVTLPLPKTLLKEVKFVSGALWLGRLKCETAKDGVTPVVTVKSWLGIVCAMQYRLDFSEVLPQLERAALCQDHQAIIGLIRNFRH